MLNQIKAWWASLTSAINTPEEKEKKVQDSLPNLPEWENEGGCPDCAESEDKKDKDSGCSECHGWFGDNSFESVRVTEKNPVCPIRGTHCVRFVG